jgi:capsular exopolysaccharide synthesis family protein
VVSADGVITQNGQAIKVSFEEKGSFGSQFQNQYFRFTLLKKVNDTATPEGEYCFSFNDLKEATLDYRNRLNATQTDQGGDIIECAIQGEEPQKEVEFLNKLISTYIEGKMNFQNEAQRRSLDFINTQLTGISDSLNTAGTKFTDFRSKNNIIDLGAEGKLVMDNLKEIESEKAKNQMQLDYFNNLLKYLKNSGDLKQIVSPSVVGIQDASLNALVLKLGELYNRRQILTFSAKETNPTVVMLDKELNQIRTQLNENLRNLIENATQSLNSQKLRQDNISVQLNKLPKKEQQMINIQRQFNLTNEIYTFLLQKRAETNIALASSIPDVQIIDDARTETAVRIGLSSSMVFIIALILGLAVPAAIFLLKEFFDNRIRTQEDVEKNTTLPILGNIMHNPIASELSVFENPKSNLAESFRDLRTNLEFMLTSQQGKVISIHSISPGDGKSFSSVNLASILAMNDNKVLLIGADLRKPKLHKIFELDNKQGLSTFLIGHHTLEEVIFPTMIENLALLPSGPIPPNPAEILSKPAMKTLIDELQTQYDYIIIDNAPAAVVTDGIIVGRLSDLNVFILRYGVSRKHQLEMINEFANRKKVNHLGLVVNDIKSNSFGYTYYRYYEYGAYQNTYYSEEDQGTVQKRKKKKKSA